jgi:GR25 family glycosyltransferase involved in LPS biosynthesis
MKLDGFPKVYYINLDRSKVRNIYIINQLKTYGISDYKRISAINSIDMDKSGFLQNTNTEKLRDVEIAIILSHLKAIKEFYESKKDWCVIFEDDIDLSTSQYWNFNWKMLFESLPKNLKILQMVLSTRKSMDINFHIHHVSHWDFNLTGYLISRDGAETILNRYFVDNKLDISSYNSTMVYDKENYSTFSTEKVPTAERIIYTAFEKDTYSIPIFNFNIDLESTANMDHYEQAKDSYNRVLEYWINKSHNFTLQDITSV